MMPINMKDVGGNDMYPIKTKKSAFFPLEPIKHAFRPSRPSTVVRSHWIGCYSNPTIITFLTSSSRWQQIGQPVPEVLRSKSRTDKTIVPQRQRVKYVTLLHLPGACTWYLIRLPTKAKGHVLQSGQNACVGKQEQSYVRHRHYICKF